mmetsp:Transcript_12019/g.55730  ORF Transcript_12019/g.55730 Transcript_12019/m.55730 type:complete len:256 (-) Transcript_12019:573-1340(-)
MLCSHSVGAYPPSSSSSKDADAGRSESGGGSQNSAGASRPSSRTSPKSPDPRSNSDCTRATSSDDLPILEEGPRAPVEYAADAALPPNIDPVVTSRSMKEATATMLLSTDSSSSSAAAASASPPVASAHADASYAAAAAAAAAATAASTALQSTFLTLPRREGQAVNPPRAAFFLSDAATAKGDAEPDPRRALAPPPVPPSLHCLAATRSSNGSSACAFTKWMHCTGQAATASSTASRPSAHWSTTRAQPNLVSM